MADEEQIVPPVAPEADATVVTETPADEEATPTEEVTPAAE